MIKRTILALTCTLMLLSFTTNINESDKAIVLINGEAYLVDVNEKGTIITTYQKIENYFSTSESHNSILTRLSMGAIADDGKKIIFYEKESEPIPSYSSENNSPVLSGNAQYIGFSPRRALLKKTAVDQIRKIAKGYESGSITSITVNAFHQDNYESRALARNRANAISGLLIAFGVNESAINTETPYGGPNTKTDYVNVAF